MKTIYFDYIGQQAAERGTEVTPFGLAVADSLFEASMAALGDHASKRPHIQVVSAPTGAGKSSYAAAFGAALVTHDDAATVLYVVETIDQAEEVFKTVSKLLPDTANIAVWTSAHDAGTSDEGIKAKGFVPSEHRFLKDDLRHHRVAVVTHRFFLGSASAKAKESIWGPRTITFVDEHPDMVGIYEVTPGDVLTVRERIAETDPHDRRVALLTDVGMMLEGQYTSSKKGRSSFEPLTLSTGLASAFADAETSATADWCRLIGLSFEKYSAVAKFLRAAADGCVFQANRQEGGKASFVAYQLEMRPMPGTVLLDATADLTGIIPVVDFMTPTQVPQVDYRNLEVIHVEAETNQRINQVTRGKATAEPYAAWIKQTVLDHTNPGEEVLVVTHKALLDHGYLGVTVDTLPHWGGRHIHLSHWGTGIGSNRWRDVSTVFLFGEFFRPKRADVATTLGLQAVTASTKTLQSANGKNLTGPCEAIQEGHLLRWSKQLAMRGRARNIEADGVCGAMRLVLTGDQRRLLRNFERLFPGATAPTVVRSSKRASQVAAKADALVYSLAAWNKTSTDGVEVSALKVANDCGIDWSKEGRRLVRHPHVVSAMSVYGIKYEAGRGKGVTSRFLKGAA